MQERGLEPLHLSVLAPKTSASANSATPAKVVARRSLAGVPIKRGPADDVNLMHVDRFRLVL